MQNNFTIIDIETIPSETMPSLEDVKANAPKSMSKPETIEKWAVENQIELYKKQALDSMKGRIVCIGCSYDDDIVTFSGNEFEVLTDFAIHIQNRMDEILSPLVFVGWNIGSFDLPWLWRKAIQHSLPSLRKAIPKDNRTCYIDLMKVWATDFKDYVSLDNCAKFLGIEHDTEGGNKVYDWWKAGEIDKIIEHCRKDIETTKQIYERIYE